MIKYLPLFSAFIGAVIAQILSHWFSLRREKEKEAKTIYQELISHNLNEIIFYLEIETNFIQEHSVMKHIDSESILNDISSKISYGNVKLMKSILDYKKSLIFIDSRGYEQNTSIFRVFFYFLDYALVILKKSKIKDDKLYEEIIKSQKLYGIWTLLNDIVGWESSKRILKYSEAWTIFFYYSLKIEDIENLIVERNLSGPPSSPLANLIRRIKEECLKIDPNKQEIIIIFDEFQCLK